MYKLLSSALLIYVFSVSTQHLNAQVDDNIMWAAVKIQKNFNSKTSVTLAPILRLDDDISHYQNSSIDLSVKHKFAKNWYGQVLSRVWFIPENKYRKFFFFDLGYSQKISQFKISSYFRTHYALTIKDRKDADFLRWGTTLSLLTYKKIQPFIFLEPFFRLNGENEFQRLRYALGLKLKPSKQLGITVALRPQTSLNTEPDVKVNHIILTLAYTIPDN